MLRATKTSARAALILAAAACALSACANHEIGKPAALSAPTPLDQFPLRTAAAPDGRRVAVVPDCSALWSNIGATRNNDAKPNFGCAEHANMAVMIADARDIDTPRPEDPADATRRSDVLAKYRKGAKTSSEKDEQAKGTVSTKVQ